MQAEQILPSRRLSAFLTFTQRYRFFLIAAGLIWYLAVVALGLPLESGMAGRIIIGALLLFLIVSVISLPRIARWWIQVRGLPTTHFYIFCLVLDTLMISAMVPLTGGAISIVFALYYFLAISNCYAFEGLGLVLANGFIGLAYAGSLLAMGRSQYAPAPLDWADILVVRIPLIFVISYYARWLARRGDRTAETEQKQYLNTLRGLLTALEARDGYTKGHSGNVGRWGVVVARSLGLSVEQQEVLLHAGELHDIGKIGVPDAILNKNGKLTVEEFAAMRGHPVVGVQIVEHVSWFTPEHRAVVRSHHEKWDGTGYPDGLQGTQIPHLARLAALCDVFDALTNDRPYRQGMLATKAMAIIENGAGTHFDPDLCRQFLRLVQGLLSLLARELGATDFSAATWSDRWARLRAVGPEGELWVYVQYEESGWRLLSTEGLAGQRVIEVVSGMAAR